MKKVNLTNKKGVEVAQAIVDDDDYDRVSKYKWHYSNGYAVTNFGYRMHRLIMLPPHDLVIDHINHNRLDNRRENLRVCTQLENSRNRSHADATLGNVYSNKNVTKWYACNIIDGRRTRSRYYDTFEEAAEVLMVMRQGKVPDE